MLFEHTGPAQVYKPPRLRTRFEAEVPPPIVAGTHRRTQTAPPHTHAHAHAARARRKRSRCNVVSIPSLCVPDALRVDDFPKGEVRTAWINMVRSPLGEWIRVPVLVARGVEVLNPLPTSPFCSPSTPPFACGVSSNRACRALRCFASMTGRPNARSHGGGAWQ